ncbi:hypothetical protein POVWA1_043290 [Plasmodium ovale wallikeri]|uniref:Uncharacterized protein n=1 Tax=Plasmodium ovale wallikeri TaxID=864142 RepID=A0A1A8ZBB5_PLAOA|nr:hypothetical protein POVWA1_043290 [Plasmodium ovale wallikeri]
MGVNQNVEGPYEQCVEKMEHAKLFFPPYRIVRNNKVEFNRTDRPLYRLRAFGRKWMGTPAKKNCAWPTKCEKILVCTPRKGRFEKR